jgi:hypothetical protein
MFKTLRMNWDRAKVEEIFRRREFLHKLEGVYTTPDAARIQSRNHWMVFVFDDLMRDRPQHGIIQRFDPLYAGKGFSERNVKSWRNTITGQVIAFDAADEEIPVWSEPNRKNASPIPVRGECFIFPSRNIFELDKIMRNRIDFVRTGIFVTRWRYYTHVCPQTGKCVNTQHLPVSDPAWMYMAHPERFAIDASTWEPLSFYPSRNEFKPRYYSFHNPKQLFT